VPAREPLAGVGGGEPFATRGTSALPAGLLDAKSPLLGSPRYLRERGSRRRACSDPEPSPLSYSSRLSLLSRLSEPVSLALVLPSGFDASAGMVTPRSFVVTGALGAS
jgi:hypothetical protein